MAATTGTRSELVTGRLLACGAVGPPLFIVVFLVDGATRPGYDPVAHAVSQLSLGGRGWVQITNFVVTGILGLAFAFGVRRVLHPGRGGTWGPLLLGAWALGLVLSGVFVMDPMRGYPPGTPPGFPAELTWQQNLHDLSGVVVFVSLPVAGLVVARRFAARPAHRGWAAYSAATAVVALVLFVVSGSAWESDSDIYGLLQRVMIVVGWLWVAALAVRLLTSIQRSRDPGARASASPPARPAGPS